MKRRNKLYQRKVDHSYIFGEHWPKVKAIFNANIKERKKLKGFIWQYLLSRLTFGQVKFDRNTLSQCYLSIDPIQAAAIYELLLDFKPNHIFEFGTSYGLSTLYLSAAVQKNQRGQVIGSELEPQKVVRAKHHLQMCQLSESVEIIEGDILKHISKLPEGLDFVLMDGFPNLNLTVFKQIEPKLSENAIILTDDVYLFFNEMKPFIQYVEASPKFTSRTIAISNGMQLTTFKSQGDLFRKVEQLLIKKSKE